MPACFFRDACYMTLAGQTGITESRLPDLILVMILRIISVAKRITENDDLWDNLGGEHDDR